MFCKKCGKQLPDGARFCTGCGTNLVATVTPTPVVAVEEPPKKKPNGKGIIIAVVALLLLIAIGVGVYIAIDYLSEEGYSDSNNDDKKDDEEKEEKQKEAYDAAMALLEEGKYDEALAAFKEISDYDKAEKQIEKLEQWQADYNAAQEMLDNQEYDAARDAFYALEDYRDSLEMAEYGVSYRQYMSEYEELTDGDRLVNTAELFESLGEYQDAPEMVDKCYLKACEYFLKDGDIFTAEEYAEYLSDDARDAFEKLLADACADTHVLKLITEAMIDWSGAETYEAEYAVWRNAFDSVLVYEDAYFMDKVLEDCMKSYLLGLNTVLEILDEDGQVSDMLEYYNATSYILSSVEKMMESCGLFADNADMYHFYEGGAEYYKSCYMLEEMMQTNFWGVTVTADDNGDYYLYVNNYTPYSFRADVTLSYSVNDVMLEEENTITIAFSAHETKYIYLPFPDAGEDTWYADWYFYDVE